MNKEITRQQIMDRKSIEMRKADLILTADWHLRETTPICRTDNFCEETQWEKVDFISALQEEHDCPVAHAGDLFDYWKPSPELLSNTIKHIPKQFHSIAGNHDLPQHSMELLAKCGLYTLVAGGHVILEDHGHWNRGMSSNWWKIKGRSVYMWHIFNWKGVLPWPMCSAPTGAKLLRQHNLDLLLTGDNHKPFVEKYEGRLLVNPGSIFRMDADQVDHKPRVYLWYAKENEVEPVYLPIKQNVVTREHIEIQKKREQRIAAFVSSINSNYSVGMSFEQNLELFKEKNKPRQSVMDLIYKAIGQ